jgi:hypothetical protein
LSDLWLREEINDFNAYDKMAKSMNDSPFVTYVTRKDECMGYMITEDCVMVVRKAGFMLVLVDERICMHERYRKT